MAVIDAPSQTTWQQDLLASARRVSAGVVGGLATGALIGGIGGRLAMFVLRVTSDPSLHGLKTDDGFTIGRFSGETLFLVLVTAALGVLGGLLYLAVRPWLPERWRAALVGVFGGIVGGALFISPGGDRLHTSRPAPARDRDVHRAPRDLRGGDEPVRRAAVAIELGRRCIVGLVVRTASAGRVRRHRTPRDRSDPADVRGVVDRSIRARRRDALAFTDDHVDRESDPPRGDRARHS